MEQEVFGGAIYTPDMVAARLRVVNGHAVAAPQPLRLFLFAALQRVSVFKKKMKTVAS